MTVYNTNNQIGSIDPRDLLDNAQNLDEALLTESTTFVDRLGRTRVSWEGAIKYSVLSETYSAGLEVTTRNQIIFSSGEWWAISGATALPYTTTGAGMPEGGAFVSVGDAVLRQELAASGGAGLVGNGGIVFDSVADMTAATWLTIGQKVRTLGYYTPGDGGGNDYEIVAAGTGTDDGGSFIDLSGSGLQAKGLFENTVNIRWFGAKGDNAFDNAVALQAAFDYLENSFSANSRKTLFVPGGDYLFTSIVTGVSNLAFCGESPYVSRLICTDFSDTEAIHFKGALIHIKDLSYETADGYEISGSLKVAYRFLRDEGCPQDYDCQITNSRINRVSRGVSFHGRGLKVHSSWFANNIYSVDLYWEGYDYYAPPANVNDNTKQDTTGFRHFEFVGVRFHSLVGGGGAIRNIGSNADKISGVLVSGCNNDIGRALWIGVLCNGLIDGCVINQTPSVALVLHGGSKNYIVSNMIISGETNTGPAPARVPDNFIRLTGNHENGTFRNMFFRDCTEHGINIRDGIVSNMNFENLFFKDPCSSEGTFAPIIFVGDGHSANLENIELTSSINLISVVRNAGASLNISADRVRVLSSSTQALSGQISSAKRLHLSGAFDRLDLVGNGSPEGVVSAYPGSTYRRASGGAGATFYVKETGTGSTGWVAK